MLLDGRHDQADQAAERPRSCLSRGTCLAATLVLAAVPPAVLAGPARGRDTAGQLDGAASADPVALHYCWSPDNGDPVLHSLTITPQVVDMRHHPVDVVITADAEDTGGPGAPSGISNIYLGVTDDHDFSLARSKEVALHRVSGTTWSGKLTLRPWIRDGGWHIWVAAAEDRVGNAAEYSRRELQRLGMDSSLDVLSTPDTTPPTITGFNIWPRIVDVHPGPRTVWFTVKARDAQSGLRGGTVWFDGAYFEYVDLHRVPDQPGILRGHVRLRNGTGSYRKDVEEGLSVRDRRGNGVFLPAWQLERRGFASGFRVTGTWDRQPPSLEGFSLAEDVLDVRTHGQWQEFTVHARDAFTGIADVEIRMWHGGRLLDGLGLNLVSGDRHDGVWRGRRLVTDCYTDGDNLFRFDRSDGGYYFLSVTVRDRVGSPWVYWPKPPNYLALGPRLLESLGLPSRYQVLAGDGAPPTAQVTSASPASVVVGFNEPVTGITPASLLVAEVTTWPRTSKVSGAWSCVAADSQAVDCETGWSSQVTFAPDTPMAAGDHVVVVNPEHELSVTDVAGNPPRRYYQWFTLEAPVP